VLWGLLVCLIIPGTFFLAGMDEVGHTFPESIGGIPIVIFGCLLCRLLHHLALEIDPRESQKALDSRAHALVSYRKIPDDATDPLPH
jgi:hypothetical protein